MSDTAVADTRRLNSKPQDLTDAYGPPRDEGIFEESFIEERRQGLEQFINKIAGHPLAQNERCLHMFLQEEAIDRNYVPGKVRHEYKGRLARNDPKQQH
ncbi:hypothetical protein A6R68_22296 [Neotoma lepida]|uniref:PX domain-containing protein n=1 Tax=Neotoma lepida TaxID=56216 RepID=A0A1A6HYZ9_NEOLE|nr:hypothetical protein A6R68_22296 [Neotoma lepida]